MVAGVSRRTSASLVTISTEIVVITNETFVAFAAAKRIFILEAKAFSD